MLSRENSGFSSIRRRIENLKPPPPLPVAALSKIRVGQRSDNVSNAILPEVADAKQGRGKFASFGCRFRNSQIHQVTKADPPNRIPKVLHQSSVDSRPHQCVNQLSSRPFPVRLRFLLHGKVNVCARLHPASKALAVDGARPPQFIVGECRSSGNESCMVW